MACGIVLCIIFCGILLSIVHQFTSLLTGLGTSEIKCMNSTGEVCDGHFSEETLRSALPEKVFERYSELQWQDSFRKEQLENIDGS